MSDEDARLLIQPLQRSLLELLDAIDVKTPQGLYLHPLVSVTMELEPYLEADRTRVDLVNTIVLVPQNAGTNVIVTVPATERWHVYGLSATLGAGAIVLRAALRFSTLASGINMEVSPIITGDTLINVGFGVLFPRPFIANPGDTFFTTALNPNAAGINVTTTVYRRRLTLKAA